MIAADFASLLDARPNGSRRWMARCPAHRDKSPSLSIGEGRDGRVLVNCFAGCILTNILHAMKLRRSDLFSSEPPSLEQRRTIETQRERQRAAGRLIGESAEYARHVEDHVHRIGAELATLSNEDPRGIQLTNQFHEACRVMHNTQMHWEQIRNGSRI